MICLQLKGIIVVSFTFIIINFVVYFCHYSLYIICIFLVKDCINVTVTESGSVLLEIPIIIYSRNQLFIYLLQTANKAQYYFWLRRSICLNAAVCTLQFCYACRPVC